MRRLLRSPRLVRLVRSWCSLVLFVGAGLLVWPSALGGDVTYLMVSGTSMEPGLHDGDLVVVREQATYEVGDVVGFRVPAGHVGEGAVVIHRIVGGDPVDGFVTEGDNRERPDVWQPTAADVVGERWFLVPGAGDWMARLRNPAPLGYLAGVLALVSVLLPSTRKRPLPAD